MARRSVGVWLVLGLCACAGVREEDALAVTRVASSQVEAGGSLRVVGSGFPAGERCEMKVRGRDRRPGLAGFDAAIALGCEATSEEEVVARLDAGAIEALGGRGTFTGELELRFPARPPARALYGKSPLRFDLLAPVAGGPLAEFRLRERARRVLGFAGIALSEEEPTLAGLVVGSVRPASRADELGVRAGDVMVAANGVSLHSLFDLAPAPNARRIALTIARPRATTPIELGIGLHGLFAPDPSAELSRTSALLTWLLCCVLLLGPLAAVPRWVVASIEQLAQAPRGALGVWGGSRARGGLLVAFASSVLGGFAVARAPSGLFAVRSFSLACGFVALQVALVLLSDDALRVRALAALGILGRMLVLGIVVGCACALSGTRSLDGMVEGQGVWPWQWALVQKPALLVAFPLYLTFAGQLGVRSRAVGRVRADGADGRAIGEGWRSLQRVSSNVALAALGAAVFAGGWQGPSELVADERLARALGALGFIAKVWGFGLLFSLVRELGPRARIGWPAVTSGCVLSVGLCALWLGIEPSVEVELALGRALFATLVACGFVTAVRLLALRARAHVSNAV